MMKSIHGLKIGTLALLLVLAGCQAGTSTAVTFGDAVRQNMALQIIDPTPVDLEHGPYEGNRRALAIQRYQTDTVEEPEDIFASEIGAEE